MHNENDSFLSYRWSLQNALLHYITETLTYMVEVKKFYLGISKWIDCRKKEHETMIIVKKKADKLDTTFTKSKAIGKHIKKNFQNDPESKLAELEKELTEVLKGTIEGLEKLNIFLDAMEKLAVTSLHVFTENQIVYLSEEFCYEEVQAVIRTAQQVCPLLLKFKRDAKSFFLPSLHNLEIIAHQLEKYIDMRLEITEEILVDGHICENSIQEMAYQIKRLDKIRTDEHFRMEFLFQEVSSSGFIDIFAANRDKMLKFLNDLEQCADQLDSMNKGAKISNLAGSSVTKTGGALSAAGVALTPVTAGASLGLTLLGSVMGAASETNSVVTTLTESGVNHTSQNKANKTFQSFMEVFQKIQDYLDDGMKYPTVNLKPSKTKGLIKEGERVSKIDPIGMGASAMISGASALKKMVAGKSDSSIQEMQGDGTASRSMSSDAPDTSDVPDASDVPDFGQSVVLSEELLSTGAETFFAGRHIVSADKESMNVLKGCKTKVSTFLTARVALFRSQIESWDKIHKSLQLCESNMTKEENRNILEEPFYLEDKE
uniref:Apolipoprotein L n=1 Tax=Fundulus heteroclitus TaxID=8078 RepID=A0A3Q2QKQ4_FUNHE